MARAQQAHSAGQVAAFSGGGTDLLQQVRDRVVSPDVLVNLRTVTGFDQVSSTDTGVTIGGAHHARCAQCATPSSAPGSPYLPRRPRASLPRRSEMSARWQGMSANGPGAGTTAMASRASRRVATSASRSAARISSMRFSGGGPSYIVHPSDLAPALVALEASFGIVGPEGERTLSASEFFVLPSQDPEHENVLGNEDLLATIELPVAGAGMRSAYHKVMDREAWTHAVVSAAVVLEMNQDICGAAHIVLGGVAPIPWRVPEAEGLLIGQRVTQELAREVGETAVEGARPLSKNGYKVPLTSAVVEAYCPGRRRGRSMNRRDFLLLRTRGSDRVLELSCERLYMQYVDAQPVAKRRGEEIDGMTEAPWWVGEPPTSMDGPDAERLFRELESDLAEADVLQVRDREWLVTGDFWDRLEALLGGFRARGGRVVAIGFVLAATLFGCAPRGPSDEVLRERVEVVLANASDLPEEIEVEVSDGVVTLTGLSPSARTVGGDRPLAASGRSNRVSVPWSARSPG